MSVVDVLLQARFPPMHQSYGSRRLDEPKGPTIQGEGQVFWTTLAIAWRNVEPEPGAFPEILFCTTNGGAALCISHGV